MKYLNQDLGFDEVRWATARTTSYDSKNSFAEIPQKTLLASGTRLYRLINVANGRYFDEVWWMPKNVFDELKNDASRSSTGAGRLFRNYVAQYLALPSGSRQLSVVEIELTQPVYAWTGKAKALFNRPGGMDQVFLPNLCARGDPRDSVCAKLVQTYWLNF